MRRPTPREVLEELDTQFRTLLEDATNLPREERRRLDDFADTATEILSTAIDDRPQFVTYCFPDRAFRVRSDVHPVPGERVSINTPGGSREGVVDDVRVRHEDEAHELVVDIDPYTTDCVDVTDPPAFVGPNAL